MITLAHSQKWEVKIASKPIFLPPISSDPFADTNLALVRPINAHNRYDRRVEVVKSGLCFQLGVYSPHLGADRHDS